MVYSKNEHETGPEWVIMQMLYWDDYERIDGRWYFRRRLPCYWYATDLNKPPIGERKMRWPGREPYDGAFHELFPSWKEFWAASRRTRKRLPRGRRTGAAGAASSPPCAAAAADAENPRALEEMTMNPLFQPVHLGDIELPTAW